MDTVSASSYAVLGHYVWNKVFLGLFPQDSPFLGWLSEGTLIGAHFINVFSALLIWRDISRRSGLTTDELLQKLRANSVWNDYQAWWLMLLGPLLGGAAGAIYYTTVYLPFCLMWKTISSLF